MWLLRALVFAAPLSALHLTAMAMAATALGAVPREVRIFYGPSRVLREDRPTIRLGVVPLGGYVTWRPVGDESADPTAFDRLAAWRRAVVLTAGNLALLSVGALLLGPQQASSAFVATYAQIASLFVDHASAVEELRAFAAADSPSLIAGTVATKMAVFNLLPFVGLNGEGLARLLVPHGRFERLDAAWGAASGIAVLAMAGAFLAAWFLM